MSVSFQSSMLLIQDWSGKTCFTDTLVNVCMHIFWCISTANLFLFIKAVFILPQIFINGEKAINLDDGQASRISCMNKTEKRMQRPEYWVNHTDIFMKLFSQNKLNLLLFNVCSFYVLILQEILQWKQISNVKISESVLLYLLMRYNGKGSIFRTS